MSLSPEEVKKVAALARFALKEAEVTAFRSELSEVIDYNAKKLAGVRKTTTPDQAVSPDLGQADDPRPSLSAGEALANAPAEKNGFFVVPKVLED